MADEEAEEAVSEEGAGYYVVELDTTTGKITTHPWGLGTIPDHDHEYEPNPPETLASFLLRCIAADEAVANAAGDGHWTAEPSDAWQAIEIVGVDMMIYDEGGHSETQAAHIARQDPAHVLAVCTAHRAIVELHSAGVDPEHGCEPRFSGNPWWDDAAPCPTLRALASAYADRDGWREEWRA